MVPNLEVEIRPGQVLTIGTQAELVLETPNDANVAAGTPPGTMTLGVSGTSIATVLVATSGTTPRW